MSVPSGSAVSTPGSSELELGQDTSAGFPYFSLLAAELRLQIWEAALDDRVVFLTTYHEAPERECLGDGGRMPYRDTMLASHVLRRVCHESRAVASRAQGEKQCFRSYYTGRKKRFSTWFDAARDYLDIAQEAQNIVLVDRLRHRHVMAHVARPLLAGGMFPQVKNIAIVRNIVTIHISQRKAEESGLFLYGESKALVNVKDATKLKRFQKLYWENPGTLSYRNACLLAVLSTTRGVATYTAYEMGDTEDLWLTAQYSFLTPEQAKENRAYLRLNLREKAFWDMRVWMSDPDGTEWGSGIFRVVDSKWARQVHADMPKFDVMIMFRICQAGQCADVKCPRSYL
ncbi:Uu.00g120520.m01.CDS01 [Anthostomella pinea]|uniref:Uu.00g120520.m01.CDS01 n=1 Tax=Anthostomella pinea TaxID=933095 RepID=A0AAI8VGR3_9PEZI|nr:Uu.00g120520.m01.CDS01 [Anthostomella pinea]